MLNGHLKNRKFKDSQKSVDLCQPARTAQAVLIEYFSQMSPLSQSTHHTYSFSLKWGVMAKMTISVLEKIETIVENGENDGFKLFTTGQKSSMLRI